MSAVLRVAIVAACLASLGHVLALLPRFVAIGSDLPASALVRFCAFGVAVFSTLCGSALALILAVRTWHRVETRGLAAFLTCAAGSWGVILRISEFNFEDGAFTVSASGQGSLLPYLLFTALMLTASAFLRFSATFPRVLTSSEIGTGRFGAVDRARRLLLNGPLVWGLGLAIPLGVPASEQAVELLGGTWAETPAFLAGTVVAVGGGFVFPVLAMTFGMQNLRTGYRSASAKDRRGLMWLTAGVMTSTWMILLPFGLIPLLMVMPTPSTPWLGNLSPVLWSLSPGVLVTSIALAMFYTGGIDPSLVLAQSTVVALVGTAWIVIFAALETVLSDWLQQTLGLPSIAVSIAVALAAAAAALPLRRIRSSHRQGASNEGS